VTAVTHAATKLKVLNGSQRSHTWGFHFAFSALVAERNPAPTFCSVFDAECKKNATGKDFVFRFQLGPWHAQLRVTSGYLFLFCSRY
jgi:hypothetical protein